MSAIDSITGSNVATTTSAATKTTAMSKSEEEEQMLLHYFRKMKMEKRELFKTIGRVLAEG